MDTSILSNARKRVGEVEIFLLHTKETGGEYHGPEVSDTTQ